MKTSLLIVPKFPGILSLASPDRALLWVRQRKGDRQSYLPPNSSMPMGSAHTTIESAHA